MNKVTQSIYKKKVDELEAGGGGGGSTTKYYKHNLWFSTTESGYTILALVEVYNKSSTPYTIDTFKADIPNLYLVYGPNCEISATGSIKGTIGGQTRVIPIYEMSYNPYANALSINYAYQDSQASHSVNKLQDTVKEVL